MRLVRKVGEEPADVALAWLLSNPVVTAPIVGRDNATTRRIAEALETSWSRLCRTRRHLPGLEAPRRSVCVVGDKHESRE